MQIITPDELTDPFMNGAEADPYYHCEDNRAQKRPQNEIHQNEYCQEKKQQEYDAPASAIRLLLVLDVRHGSRLRKFATF